MNFNQLILKCFIDVVRLPCLGAIILNDLRYSDGMIGVTAITSAKLAQVKLNPKIRGCCPSLAWATSREAPASPFQTIYAESVEVEASAS